MAEPAPGGALGVCRRAARRALVALVAAVALQPAWAERTAPDPRWEALAPAQQEILAPLADQWNGLDASSRGRWLGVAKRYPKMTPIGQKRVQTRMKKWAALTPQQREEARAKYKKMKRKRGSKELKREWQQYQALSPQEREALAAPAHTRKPKTPRGRASGAPAPETFSQ